MTSSPRPRVSVVIPTFNRSAWLVEAIESVCAQTFRDLEIIVVDDGSTDDTAQRLKALGRMDKPVRYLSQENSGPSAARNRGIDAAQGEFVALLDSDDRWLPVKLERQMDVLARCPEVDVVYTGFAYMDESGMRLAAEQQWEPPPRRGTLYEDLMYANIIRGSDSAVLARTAALRGIGGFDATLYAAEDQDLWRRLAILHRFEMIEEVLVLIRLHGTNIQRDASRMAEGSFKHFSKMVHETPAEYRHHLPMVANAIIGQFGAALIDQGSSVRAAVYVARFFVRQPRESLAALCLVHVLKGRHFLVDLLKAVHRRLPGPARGAAQWMWRIVRRRPG
jgi:glycosyltransferase involved in cell wall biosynthesis